MNNETSVWIHAFSCDMRSVQEQLASSLAQHQLQLRHLVVEKPKGPGLLFFEELTSELYRFIEQVSCRGQEQILVIALTSQPISDEQYWYLLKSGAADVFRWNDDSSDIVERIVARLLRWIKVERLLNSPLVQKNLIGQSLVWRNLLKGIVEVACFTDASVLIMGETGTGKELVARLIHSLDPRVKDQELVILDCSTIVPELAGSEFFGHERGAFTGALMAREGAFALANGGTLFLDEIGELPLHLQVQLLRVIQEGTYKKVGSNTWKSTRFRLICATNRDLFEEVGKGRFRADLFYRIASWTFHLPPLRERKEDILPLALHFLKTNRFNEGVPSDIDEPVRHYLLQRNYPGNIRELMQLMTRLGSRHVGPGPVTLGDIPIDERLTNSETLSEWRDPRFEQSIRDALMLGLGIKEIGRATSETAIRIVLKEEDGNLQRAAKRLGITDRALQLRQASQRSSLANIVSG